MASRVGIERAPSVDDGSLTGVWVTFERSRSIMGALRLLCCRRSLLPGSCCERRRLGLSPSIRRRISANSDRGTATSANLANFLRTLALPAEVEHWSLTTLREKLVKIGARIVRHGRYVVFQLAEVAVPRALFAEILRRIDRLRRRPLLT